MNPSLRPPTAVKRAVTLLAVIACLGGVGVLSGSPAGAQVVEPYVYTLPASGYPALEQVELGIGGWGEFQEVALCTTALAATEPADPADPAFPSLADLCGERPNTVFADISGEKDFVSYPERIIWVPRFERWVDCDVERCGHVAAAYPEGTPIAWAPIQFAPRPPPPASPPTVTLSPSTTPGRVTVDIHGARPGAVLQIKQCGPAPTGYHDCRPGLTTVARADAAGSARLTRYVEERIEPLGGDAVDCTEPLSCTLTVIDADDPWRHAVSAPVWAPVPTAVPRIVPGAAAVEEGDTGTAVVHVPVTLDVAAPYEVTAQWTTLEVPEAPAGQATAGIDYQPASGTVVFPPGTTTATVPVTINGDVVPDPDAYIVVQFGNATNARMGGFWGLGFGGILDDD